MMNKRRYKVFNHDIGPYYFDLESSMRERVMMILLTGTDVNVFDQHKKKFVRMTQGTKNLREWFRKGQK
jgi:phosphoserine phosphatase